MAQLISRYGGRCEETHVLALGFHPPALQLYSSTLHSLTTLALGLALLSVRVLLKVCLRLYWGLTMVFLQLGVGSSSGDLVALPALPTMLSSWSHVGIMLMTLSFLLEGSLYPEAQWFFVCLHCIIIFLLACTCFWLTGSLFSCRLQLQGIGSLTLLSKVSYLSLLHSFSSIFHFYWG